MILCEIVLTEGLRELVAQKLPLKHVNPEKSHPIETRKTFANGFSQKSDPLVLESFETGFESPSEFTKTTKGLFTGI